MLRKVAEKASKAGETVIVERMIQRLANLVIAP